MAQVDIDIKSVLTIGCVCIFVVAVSLFYLGGTLQPLICLINKIKYYLNSYNFLSYDSVFVFYPSAIKG